MISVVIPLYNKERSITQTLDSVLAQTYTDFECIIVNDGSTDNSPRVAEKWLSARNEEQDTRFRLINKENGGVSSARNRGIEAARGELVAFLDGDDLWATTFLEELSKLVQDYPKKGLYNLGCLNITGNVIPPNETVNFYRGEVTQWGNKQVIYSSSSSAAYKETLLAIGGFDERLSYGEDKDVWYRLQLHAGAASYLKPLSYYRQDAENRAMLRVRPLNMHLVYYMDKFDDARSKDPEFRRFFDTEMVQTLFPYMFDNLYKEDAKRLAKHIDYSDLKWSLHFRMEHPLIYKVYMALKDLLGV